MTPKLRILHLTHSLNQGGVERQLVQILPRLATDFDFEIGILHPTDSEDFFFKPELEANHLPYTFLDKYPGKLARIPFVWRYWRLLNRFRPQIIHAHDWHAMDIARAYHQVMGGAKVIVHVRNDLLAFDRVPAETRWAKAADVIITVAESVAQQYRDHIPASRSHLITIPNGINTDFFVAGERGQARQHLETPLSPEIQLGLFVGRYAPQKNLPLLLKALQQLVAEGLWQPHWHILCIGRSDPQDYLAELLTYRQTHHLEPFIQFLPAQKNILPYYQACDFLILPSHFEGMPNVVLEAAACARPTLISTAANADQLIEAPERGWLFAENDLAALQENLLAAFRLDRTQRDQRGQNARQYMLHNYSFSAILPHYHAVYNRLGSSV